MWLRALLFQDYLSHKTFKYNPMIASRPGLEFAVKIMHSWYALKMCEKRLLSTTDWWVGGNDLPWKKYALSYYTSMYIIVSITPNGRTATLIWIWKTIIHSFWEVTEGGIQKLHCPYSSFFHEICNHDDNSSVLLPNHSPEIFECRL